MEEASEETIFKVVGLRISFLLISNLYILMIKFDKYEAAHRTLGATVY